MIAIDIIPVRRLPGDRDTFTYLWPGEKAPTLGSVVRIPFARSHLDGVVWRILPTVPKTEYPLRPIVGVQCTFTVFTDWQRQVMTAFSERYDVSLSSLVYQYAPDIWPKDIPTSFPSSINTRPNIEIIWYGHRQDAETTMKKYIDGHGLTCIIEPTVEEAEIMAKVFPGAVAYDGQTSPAEYRRIFQGVLSGTIKNIIGTPLALFLPFPSEPTIILDQEEHPQYKRTERQPYAHAGRFLDGAKIPHIKLTAAPSVRTKFALNPSTPTRHIERHIGTLGGPGVEPWHSPEVDQAISAQPELPRVWILPRRGYASILVCRSCGHEVSCKSCGRKIRIMRHDARHSRCTACQTLQPLPTACPTCRAVNWRYIGIGIEQWQKRWPSDNGHDHILTIHDTNILRTIPGPKIVTIVSADTLLAWPDFTAAERAMIMIGRLESMLSDGDQLFLQTFEPQIRLWERWLNGSSAWFEDERTQRQTYHFPPETEHWLLIPPNEDQTIRRSVETKLRDLGLAVTELTLSGRSKKPLPRLLIHGDTTHPLDRAKIKSVLPPSWRVDIDVDAWVP